MQQVHLFSPSNGGGGGGHIMNNINKMNNKNNKKRRGGGGDKGHKKSNNNKNDNLENAGNPEANVNRNGMGSITYNNSLGSVFTTETRYYGCEKNTKSCIGQVFNAKPFYMYLGKHTPPCCMEKLKAVLHHVIEELENVGIRYWLDNLALKSAIEINSVSVDAYEIDVSFNLHDLERSNALVKSQIRPFADDQGFYWIKATDGHYFKVQFSKINQIGVNLLPFDILADKVKPNGFYGWKAKEFSSDYLHPMSTVLFLGKNILCPNNVREYLEMKKLQ
jgi:fukutin-related protein